MIFNVIHLIFDTDPSLLHSFRSINDLILSFFSFFCCISTTWDGQPLSKAACSDIVLQSGSSSHLTVQVRAPFYNDPKAPTLSGEGGQVVATVGGHAPAIVGEPFQQLWDYEGTVNENIIIVIILV